MSAKKILVVEDHAATLKFLSQKLKSHGYEVVGAADSAEAVAAVRQAHPDLIVLDLNLRTNPLFGGAQWDAFGMLAWLKRNQADKPIPTVVLTSPDQANLKQKALDAGALAHFQKPPRDKDFFEVIDSALGQTGATSTVPATTTLPIPPATSLTPNPPPPPSRAA